MTWTSRSTRPLAPLALALALASGFAPAPARAQEPPPAEGAEGEGSGRPLDGYLATGVLAGLAIFMVAKSARRS